MSPAAEPLAGTDFDAGWLAVDGVCSLAALWTRDLDIAKQFWYRYHRDIERQQVKKPESPYHLCLLTEPQCATRLAYGPARRLGSLSDLRLAGRPADVDPRLEQRGSLQPGTGVFGDALQNPRRDAGV